MYYYRVLYDFTAEDRVEVSVHKGELLCAPERVIQDGWVKVEVITDPHRHGFVPLSYVEEISEAQATQGRGLRAGSHEPPHHGYVNDPTSSPSGFNHQEGSSNTNSKVPVSAVSLHNNSPYSNSVANMEHSRNTADNNYSQGAYKVQGSRSPFRSPQSRSSPSGNKDSSSAMALGSPGRPSVSPLTPAQASSGPVNRSLLTNPSTVVDAFMKNEVYFKQLMRQRKDALGQMQSELEEAMADVAACKDKDAAFARKLHDLDQVIEKERARWSERLKEEKAFILRSVTFRGDTVPIESNSKTATPMGDRRQSPGPSRNIVLGDKQ